MTRYSFHPLILCVISLSIIGLLYQLYDNPAKLLQQVLIMIVITAIIFFLVKKFITHKQSSTAQYSSHYSQANRTNYKSNVKSNVLPHKKKKDSKKTTRALVKKRPDVTLTVIEGKKNKKKNRALF